MEDIQEIVLKHLQGQHNQKLHGNRGAKISSEAISGLDKPVQAYYNSLSEGDKVKYRLAWYRELKKNPNANSFDFMVARRAQGANSEPLDTTGKNTREPADIVGQPMPGTKAYNDEVMKMVNDHNAMVNRNGYDKPSVLGGYAQSYSEPISFKTLNEAHAWLEELDGQVTDGKYENHRVNNSNYGYTTSSRNAWYARGRSSPASMLLATKVVVDPTKPTSFPRAFTANNFNLSFRDLGWLMSKDHVYGKDFFRAVYSHASDKQVKDILTSITNAIQGK